MARSTPSGIRRRNPERTKRRLLQAAVALFAERGYHGVAVDEIVTRARENKRMVYYYFRSKRSIYLAALLEVFSGLERVEFEAVLSDAGPEQQLRDLMAVYFDFLDRNPAFVRMLLWENLERGKNITYATELLSKNPFSRRFREIVEAGVKAGVFRAPADIRHLLVNLIGLCFIYHSNRYSLAVSLGLDLDSARSRRLRLTQALDLLFHGLKAG